MDQMSQEQRIVPVILAGGQGTRLWPMSRAARPKQFIPFDGETSLFQQTLKRVAHPARYAPAIIMTNEDYRFLAAEQAQETGVMVEAILLEPVARNTGPAITAAVEYARKALGAQVLHILPSDHLVDADAEYWRSVDLGAEAARRGHMVTFGIAPTHPETGYGYIETGAQVSPGVFGARFTEKPARAQAEAMLAAGNYVWNAGIFMFDSSAFMAEIDAHAPAVAEAVRHAVDGARDDLDFTRLNVDAFARAPSISIDYALFEKSSKVAVVPVRYTWSDLGSWDAVWKAGTPDENRNVAPANAHLSETKGALVISEKAHVVVDGLEDIAVIASEDAIYVGRLSRAQNVGALVKQLKGDARTAPLTEVHKTVYRPWGGYSSILVGERFQVKKLFVKPGKKLSLQKHQHRAEHWIVVTGTAEVTIDDTVQTLAENQSIYLPQGCAHRLANPGDTVLELIEVQTGSYLGEDDIIRLEDDFGRA